MRVGLYVGQLIREYIRYISSRLFGAFTIMKRLMKQLRFSVRKEKHE